MISFAGIFLEHIPSFLDEMAIFKKHLWDGCFRLRQKKTLFSNQIGAAARYCFEVKKSKSLKTTFSLDHSVAI